MAWIALVSLSTTPSQIITRNATGKMIEFIETEPEQVKLNF